MREYPKQIKRLIHEYAARAYEAELGQALGELEAEFTRCEMIPGALLEALEPILAFYEHERTEPGQGSA